MGERRNNLYCLNNLRKRLSGKKKREEARGRRKQGVERRGDDASRHEVSLVTAVTEKATDNRDYNYSFQHPPSMLEIAVAAMIRVCTWEGTHKP